MTADTFGSHLPKLQLTEDEVTAALHAAGLRRGERYLEPGSGEGVGLVVASRDFGAEAHGIELDAASVERAIERAEHEAVDIVVATGDLRDHALGEADVVLLYLGPAFHDLLADRLATELSPGSRVVSWGWQVPGWLPDPASNELAQAWVYRPADPQNRASWGATPASRKLPAGHTLEALEVTAHADLTNLAVAVRGTSSGWINRATVTSDTLARGQSTWVELEWSPTATSAAGSVTLQLTSAGDPVGPELELAATVLA